MRIFGWFNGNTVFFILATCIVAGTLVYSHTLSNKIAANEKQKVELWAEAQTTILKTHNAAELKLAAKISSENKDIPIIETNEHDSINSINCVNLDNHLIQTDSLYLKHKLAEFKKQHAPIVVVLSEQPYTANYYYYGKSRLQQQVRYYPLVQLVIVGLFIITVVMAQKTTYKNMQNRLWISMAKETAHQLGTPVSSLQGWIEMMKEQSPNYKVLNEMKKDVHRLTLITDRFSKIGSTPQLEATDLVTNIHNTCDYIRKRAGGKVNIEVHATQPKIVALVCPSLFDWVIENLLKNALDALEGKGTISITISENANKLIIDVIDTGKGISNAYRKKVFKPGFTTKKRGWGLGLTLSKRIIEQYHKGKLYIKWSEVGKGTCFRIELPNKLA